MRQEQKEIFHGKIVAFQNCLKIAIEKFGGDQVWDFLVEAEHWVDQFNSLESPLKNIYDEHPFYTCCMRDYPDVAKLILESTDFFKKGRGWEKKKMIKRGYSQYRWTVMETH